MKNTHDFLYSLTHKVCRYSAVFYFSLVGITIANAQPSSFVKGVYVSVSTEPTFVLYGDSSASTLDCLNTMCKLNYIDGICFRILWKDLTVDSSHGVMSISIYKEPLNQLMEVAISQHKAVALAIYAGAFTPSSVTSSMPANHVLSNIYLASESGGPCHVKNLTTPNLSAKTYNIPCPWDSLYQVNFRNMMRILNRYLIQNNISLSYTIFTGINEFSGETRLPNDILETRDGGGNINFFQNDYVLWKNAGYEGHTVDPNHNQVRSTFDLFLNSIYNYYAPYKNSVLCVQSMGVTTEFPEIPVRLPEAPYNNPNSLNYYACASNYDSATDVFYDMLQDAINSKRPGSSVATMYCSLSEDYTGHDYVSIVNDSKDNNTALCSSFKAYHLRDVEFITGTVAPSAVDQKFTTDFSKAMTNGINEGAQFIEVFAYDILASQQAKNQSLKSQLQQALNTAHQQLATISPDYRGNPASTTISADTVKKDSILFSIPALPAVVSYSWLLDGVSKGSGSNLLKFGLVKSLIAQGSHTVSVNYSTYCGTNSASLNYKNGILSPSVMQTGIPDDNNGFSVRQVTPRNFTISFSSPVENARICVFNIAGQQILSTTISGSEFNFNLYSVAVGLYLVKVLAPGNQINGTVKISVAQ